MAARLQDEGNDVLVYYMPPKPMLTPEERYIGEGIINVAKTWEQFATWARGGFNEPSAVAVFDSSDHGHKADELRARGVAVIGSSVYCDRLEGDREYAFELAQACGMAIPKYHAFSTVSDAIAWLRARPADEEWFFKTHRLLDASVTGGGDRARLTARLTYVRAKYGDRIKNVLQEKIDGIAISTAGYWNGQTFLRPWEGTLERKESGNDDTGPKTGCSMNVVWFYPNETQIAREIHFDKLAEHLRKNYAPPGIYDINAICSFTDGKVYFLEFTPRYGYDAEPTAQRLLDVPYGDFLFRLTEGTLPMAPFTLERAAFSIRLAVPPYPFEVPYGVLPERKSLFGLPLLGLDGLWAQRDRDRFIAYGVMERDGGYALADPSGLVGLASAVGTDLATMNAACVKYAKGLGIADLSYRTDAGAALAKDLAAVRKAGFPTPRIDVRREETAAVG
jgi:phosphoribosylamine-glycine ligase